MPIRRHCLPALMLSLCVLAACAPVGQHQRQEPEAQPIVLRASGFGTYDNVEKDRADPRKRLLAQRASRLDAYRNLAEQVYGAVIYGGATVQDFVLHNDRFRVYVDNHLRGARVVAVNEHGDGVIETVMELELDPALQACLAGRGECPLTGASRHEPVDALETRSADSLYYLE